MATKEWCSVVVDIGKTMGLGRGSKRADAIEAVKTFLTQKMMFNKKDEVSIVLVGTAETDNDVAEALPGEGYENIVDLTKGFSPASMATLKQLGHLPDTAVDADIVCGVIVAIKLFAAASGAKRGTGRILVISDGLVQPAPGKAVLDQAIRDKLVAQGITIDVFAVGNWGSGGAAPAAAAAPLDSDDDGGGASKAHPDSLGFRPLLIELARTTGGRIDALASAQAIMGALRTRAVLQRSKYRVDLDIGCGGVRIPVFGYGFTAEAKAESLKKTTVRAVTSAAAGTAAGEGDEDAGMAEAEDDAFAGGSGGSRRGAKDVTLQRGYMRVPAAAAASAGDGGDDEEPPAPLSASEAAAAELLTSDELIKAFKYGSTYVVPVAGDALAWKLKSEGPAATGSDQRPGPSPGPPARSFKLLGFQAAESFGRHVFLGAADLIVAKPPAAAPEGGQAYSDAASRALSALARALAIHSMVGVARLVYQANAAPKIGLLIPGLVPQGLPLHLRGHLQLSTHAALPSPAGTDCLFFLPIPWQEDVRHFTFGAFAENPTFEPSEAQLKAVDNLIGALDMTAVTGPDGATRELLQPSETFNPALHRINQVVQSRLINGEGSPFPPVDSRIEESVHPERRMMAGEAAAKAVAGFAAAFGPGLSRVAGSGVLGSRALYCEIGDASTGGAVGVSATGRTAAAGLGVSRAGGGVLGGLSLGDPAAAASDSSRGVQLRVGTVAPLEDFLAQMQAAGGNATAISSSTAQLREVVVQLSADACSLGKALECLLEYRRQAVQRPGLLVPAFNAFMKELRAAQGPSASPPHGSMFWQRLLCTSTSLVTHAECQQQSGLGSEASGGGGSWGVTVQESEDFLRASAQSERSAGAAAVAAADGCDFDVLE